MKPSFNVYHPEIDRLIKESRSRYEHQKISSWMTWAKFVIAALCGLCLGSFLAGCVSTTFKNGEMSMTRSAPMWSAVGIGEVSFYDSNGKLIAQMKGYQNDGSVKAINALGDTFLKAGEALKATAAETVK